MAPVRKPRSAVSTAGPLSASRSERAALQPLDAALQSERDGKVVVRVGDDEFELPLLALHTLKHTVHELARGNSVQVLDVPHTLTTQQAADLLNVSRPYLCTLIDRGELPATKIGSHRKVRLDDLLRFRKGLEAQRRASLKKLTELSEDLGIPF